MALEPYVRQVADGMKEYYGDAAPSASTDGTFAVGDRVINTAPAAGGNPGWVCTTAGAPGTWKAMADLDA